MGADAVELRPREERKGLETKDDLRRVTERQAPEWQTPIYTLSRVANALI